jgi:hypothetical protein
MVSDYLTAPIMYVIALSTAYLIGSYILLYKCRYATIVYDAIYKIILIRVLTLTLLIAALFINNRLVINSYLLIIIMLIMIAVIYKYTRIIGGSEKYYYMISKLPYTFGDKWLKHIFREVLVYVSIAALYAPISLIIMAFLQITGYIIAVLLSLTIISLAMLLVYIVFSKSHYSVLISISIDVLLIAYTIASMLGMLTNILLSTIFVTTYIYLLLYLGVVSSVTVDIVKGIFNNYLPYYIIESRNPNTKTIISFIKYILTRDVIENPLLIIVFSKPPSLLWDQLLKYFRAKMFRELNILGLYNIVFSHYAVPGKLIDIKECNMKPCIRVREAPPNKSLIVNELSRITSENYTVLVIIEDILDLANMFGGAAELVKFLKELTAMITSKKRLYLICIYPRIPTGEKALGLASEKIRLLLTSCTAGVAKL